MGVRIGKSRSIFGAGRGWGGGGAGARRIPVDEEAALVVKEMEARSPLLNYARWREDYLTAHPQKRLFPTIFRGVEKATEPVWKPQRFISITPKGKKIMKPITEPIKRVSDTARFIQKYGIWIVLGVVLLAVAE